MPRHYVVINENVPHCYHGGGGITAYSAILSMLEKGEKVSLLALSSGGPAGGKSAEQHIGHLQDLGAEVTVLPDEEAGGSPNLYRRIFPEPDNCFSGLKKRGVVRDYLLRERPNAIFMYHWNAVASAYGMKDFPKLGIVGDPIHLPILFRGEFYKHYNYNKSILRSMARYVENIINKRTISFLKKRMKMFLSDCEKRGAFAAHHAKMLEDLGAGQCQYYRTPVLDPLPYKKSVKRSTRFKISHIGILKGIATLSGIELLARDILPRLSERLHEGSFEIHIIGGHYEEVPDELKRMLNHPSVKIRGPVYPADEEFLSSDIMLVPTPIELGIRVRIINSFSFGSCVVAHKSNTLGIPELIHGENCLLGDDGKSLADCCVKLYENRGLREKLGEHARSTYKKYFSPSSAGSAISETLENISK